MEDFTPKGTPEANEKAKEKLENMLSPEEKRALGLDIESDMPQDLNELYDPILESNLEFLLTLTASLHKWEEKFIKLKTKDEREKKGGSKILLKEIVNSMQERADSINMLEKYGGVQEKKEYGQLNQRLTTLKQKILEITNPSTSHH